MATWSLKKTLAARTSNAGIPASIAWDEASKLYFPKDISGTDHAHVYDMVADTITQISNGASSFTDFTTPALLWEDGALIYFESGLYALVSETGASPPSRIYKYSTGTTWNSVDSLTPTSADVAHWIAKSDVHLLYGAANTSSVDMDIRYSDDGATWNDGSFSATTTEPGSITSRGLQQTKGRKGAGVGLWARWESNTVAFPNHLALLMKWNDVSTLSEQFHYKKASGVKVSGDDFVLDFFLWSNLHWQDPSGSYQFEAEPLTGSFTTPSNDDVQPIETIGLPTKSIGRDFVSPNHKLYIKAGTEWDAGENVTTNSGTIHALFRNTSNGNSYLLFENTTSGNYEIWERSEAIADSAGLNYVLTHSAGGIPGAILVTS